MRELKKTVTLYRTAFGSVVFLCMMIMLAGCATEAPEAPPEVLHLPDYQPRPAAPVIMELPPPPFDDPGPLPQKAEPVPEVREWEILFIVEPAEGYRFSDGYISAVYQDDPPRISIEYGHKEVDGANTKWYSHEVNLDGKVYRKTGKNSIPFVRGKDHLWWNEDVLNLPAPIQKVIEVQILDQYRDAVHHFTIRKEVVEK